jgi:hypothetical protein
MIIRSIINPMNSMCKLEKNKRSISVAFFPTSLLNITFVPAQIAQLVVIKAASVRSIYISPCRAKKSEVNTKPSMVIVVEMPNKNVP